MKSIFHVVASTPEDLRREVILWHKMQADRATQELTIHKRPTQVMVAQYNREIAVHRGAARFWEEVHIDRIQPTSVSGASIGETTS